jgi:anti-anti-sigma regulatory factor
VTCISRARPFTDSQSSLAGALQSHPLQLTDRASIHVGRYFHADRRLSGRPIWFTSKEDALAALARGVWVWLAMKFYLIVANGPKMGMPIEITIDLFIVGSDRMCQLRNKRLGPKHCAFVTQDKKVFIRDMDCGKPTVVNGEVVPPGQLWALHAGDRILLENLEFMIQFREKPLSQRDLEEWAAHCLDADLGRELMDEDEFRPPTNASEAAQSIIDRLSAQRGLIKGRLRVGIDGDTTTVRFNDRHLVEEAEIALIRRELQDQLSKPNLRVLLDFKNVRRLSTSAVVMICDLSRWLRNKGSTVAMCRIAPELTTILRVLEVENIPRYGDKRLALTAKW